MNSTIFSEQIFRIEANEELIYNKISAPVKC